jgi:hypothetical protein
MARPITEAYAKPVLQAVFIMEFLDGIEQDTELKSNAINAVSSHLTRKYSGYFMSMKI